jgi:hypothetical protein
MENKVLSIIALILQLGGFAILLYSDWRIALGVLLVCWGTNLHKKYLE